MRGAPQIELHAADIDPAAVACARANLEPLGATTHCGDLYAALPATLRGGFDVIVVNAPYVPTDELRLLPPEARLHESRVALDGGADGLNARARRGRYDILTIDRAPDGKCGSGPPHSGSRLTGGRSLRIIGPADVRPDRLEAAGDVPSKRINGCFVFWGVVVVLWGMVIIL